jgi:hypothetical protein
VPFYLWVLRWLPFAVSHGHNPLVTDYLNAPEGVNLMWNTSLVLPALLLAPMQGPGVLSICPVHS